MKNEYTYKDLTIDEMIDYILKNAPADKGWFKKVAFTEKRTKNGIKPVYNHLKAKKAFCEKYMPEIIPAKKAVVPNKSDQILNW